MFTVVCMLCDHWRSAAIATALLASPTLLAIAFLLPETPKWYNFSKNNIRNIRYYTIKLRYVSKGRFADAKWASARINYLGGKEEQGNVGEIHIRHPRKAYTIKDLLLSRAIAARTVILCSLWFATRYDDLYEYKINLLHHFFEEFQLIRIW